MRAPGPFRVYVGLVPTGYLNRAAIDEAVAKGALYCGNSQFKDALVLSDVEMAHTKWARHSYTHPEIVRAIVKNLTNQLSGEVRIIAEAAKGLSTHRVLARAHGNSDHYAARGYFELEREFPGRVFVQAAEDLPAARYCLSKNLSDKARQINALEALSLPNMRVLSPKLRTDIMFDGLSGALALLVGHNPLRNVADYLEIANPHLIVSDGIISAVGPNRMTGRGHELGVVLASNDAVAHDMVAARIFNLETDRIEHLKRALSYGWGPAAFSEIELGGAGLDGVLSLSSKTRFWNFGLHTLETFEARFQAEHPGFRLRLQKVTKTASCTLAEKSVIAWLFKTYDFPKKAMNLAFWPSTKILTDAVSVQNILSAQVPDRVVTLGTAATESFHKAVAMLFWEFPYRKLFRLPYGIIVRSVQLRNGSRAIWYCLPIDATALAATSALSWVLTLIHGGKMTWHLFRPSYVADRLAYLVRFFFKRKPVSKAPRILTSRMPHNAWWIAPIRAKKTLAPAPEHRN